MIATTITFPLSSPTKLFVKPSRQRAKPAAAALRGEAAGPPAGGLNPPDDAVLEESPRTTRKQQGGHPAWAAKTEPIESQHKEKSPSAHLLPCPTALLAAS